MNETNKYVWRVKLDGEISKWADSPTRCLLLTRIAPTFISSFDFFFLVKERTSLKNEALQKHLLSVEKIAQERGLTPEEIDALLNIALSGKFGKKKKRQLYYVSLLLCFYILLGHFST